MLRRLLVIALGSILVGWATLFALTYLVERPVLIWTAPVLGAHWVATAKLSLDCMALAATGWVIGRLHRDTPVVGALLFAATLAFCNIDSLLDVNVLALIRLAADALHDTRLLGPLATTAVQYSFLFGSLMVGALLSRPSTAPLSIFRENMRRPV